MSINIGINNVARNTKNAYIGIDGKARQLVAAYVGDANGKARLVWEAIKKKLSSLKGTITSGTVTDTISTSTVHCAYANNDNNVLVGAYTIGNSGINSVYLYNCKLNDSGGISSFTRYEANYEQLDNWETKMESINKFNDTYGACVYSFMNTSSSGSDYRYLDVFNLNNSSARTSRLSVDSGTLDRSMPMVKLNYDTIMVPDYGTGGYSYCKLIRCENGTAVNKRDLTLTNNMPYSSSYDVIWYDRCVAFALSNDRFASFSTIRQKYTTENNSTTMRLLLNIYQYSYDASGNITVTNVSNQILPYVYITNVIDMGDDYFIGVSANTATGFYIDKNNNITMSNTISDANGFSSSRIGTSDSIYCTWYTKYSIIYYNKKSNILEKTGTGTRGNTNIPIIPYKDQGVFEVTSSSGKITFNKTEFS